MAWNPGQRRSQRALEDPYEDVPQHLAQPLWNWLVGGFQAAPYGLDAQRLQQIAIDLRIPLSGDEDQQLLRLLERCNADPTFMLDIAEALLERYRWDGNRGRALADLLNAANSAYRVNASCDALEHRVTPGVKDAVAEAVRASKGSAGDHLTAAWNAAYGRKPDPSKAYSEAVKAAESALAPHVSPQNGRQTLGTMIRDVSAKPTKWHFVLNDPCGGGVNTVLQMMQTLWHGQTSRHGGASPTRLETARESQAAIHIAAALVQFGSSGAFAPV